MGHKHICSICDRGYAHRQSLWNHKKSCQRKSVEYKPLKEIPRYESLKDIPGYESLKNDDTASEISFGTANRIINGDQDEGAEKMSLERDIRDCADYITRIDDDESVTSDESGKSRESDEKCDDESVTSDESGKSRESDDEDEYKLFDSASLNMNKIPTIDDVERIVRGTGGSSPPQKEEKEEEDEDGQPLIFSEEPVESDEEIQKELDQEDIEKVLPDFIETRIKEPRKRLMILLRHLKGANDDDEYVVRLEQLIDEFLRGNKKVKKEIEDIFRTLKSTSTTIEMEILLNKIDDLKTRFTDIFRKLDEAEQHEIPTVLKGLRREQQISRKAYEKLIEDDTANWLPSIVKVLKAHPHRRDDAVINGEGLVVYLPGTERGLKEKLALLFAEYKAGNTTTSNEIIAILDRLLEQDFITEEEYNELNNCLDSDQ